MYNVIIIGGGLAGLTCALHLSRQKYKVLLIEKYKYPHHRVCGEYVSNEVLPYLNSLGIHPISKGAKQITKFEISNKKGSLIKTKLPLGGFGMGRAAFDEMLYEAIRDLTDVIFDTVENFAFEHSYFTISTLNKDTYHAEFVVGAFGKRSNIDTFMNRNFIRKNSPWLAVKAHYNYDFPNDTVALHNFEGGYCGLSKTETNAVNACYLTTYDSFKRFQNILDFQENVVSKNIHLNHFFSNAESLFDKPLTISQISFEKKQPVEEHIFMIGDSAGLIHPLCGNGMAMAIHSAKIFSELFLKNSSSGSIDRLKMETEYNALWRKNFSGRLKTGRRIQNLLQYPLITTIGFTAGQVFPSLVTELIKKTHGNPIL